MAKKSKTQRAKASKARKARKAERAKEALNLEHEAEEAAKTNYKEASTKPKLGFTKKSRAESPEKAKGPSSGKTSKKGEAKKAEAKKPKKKRFQFLHDVRSELKRVTWPTRIDVLRWTGVVIVALVFFGVFVAILDNLIVTPLLVLISGADPSTIDFSSFAGAAADASSASTGS